MQLFGDGDASPIPTEYQMYGPGVYDGFRLGSQHMVILDREFGHYRPTPCFSRAAFGDRKLTPSSLFGRLR
ncbi:hypothetical protein ABW45_11815 [Stenotrophomonas maltophilia]|nr:hypothetical protein ABW45_11815 [Stenotrophomonas maltophilia]